MTDLDRPGRARKQRLDRIVLVFCLFCCHRTRSKIGGRSLDTRDSSEWYTVCMSASLVEKDRMFNTFSLPVQIYAHIHRACNGRTVKYRV
jgi:hypothetical protein